MNKLKLSLSALIIMLISLSTTPVQAAKITHIYTSNTPPISMPSGTTGSGIAYKAVEEIMKRAQVDIPISFGDWDVVYEKALHNTGSALFPMVMTSERRNNFFWVGPISSLDYYVYKPRGSNIKINTMDDIRNAKSIAVVRKFAVVQTLKDSGCTNLVYFDTVEQALNSLLTGNTTIGIFPDSSVNIFLNRMGVKYTRHLIPVHLFMKRTLYYALNKKTSPQVAIYMQRVLQEMRRDGTLEALYKKYMPGSRIPSIPESPVFPNEIILPKQVVFNEPLIINGKAVPTIKSNFVERRAIQSAVLTKEGRVVSGAPRQGITIYAEEFPPFTFSVNNSNYIQGAVAELVSAIQNELGQTPDPIQLSEWNSVFYLAKTTPYSAICTLKRTPERENDFYWIGPYAADSAWLYVRRDSPLTAASIQDAKFIPAIACVGGAYAGTVLSRLGFSNLMPYSTPTEAMHDMMTNPEHASAFSSVTAPYVARDSGYSAINMRPLIQISKTTDYYIGISKQTPPEVAQAWQNAFEVLKQRGVVKQIMQRWIK